MCHSNIFELTLKSQKINLISQIFLPSRDFSRNLFFFYLQWRVVRVVEPRPWTQTARTTWWTSSEPRCVFVISLFATASMLLLITPTQSVESLVIRISYFWPIITSDLLRLLTLTKKILCLSMTLTNRESPPCWALTILLIIVTGIMNHLFY